MQILPPAEISAAFLHVGGEYFEIYVCLDVHIKVVCFRQKSFQCKLAPALRKWDLSGQCLGHQRDQNGSWNSMNKLIVKT